MVPFIVRQAAGVTGIALLGACASPTVTHTYTPPGPLTSIENVRTIDASFDATWTSLINYVSGTYFGIRNFEKASGLLTLSFGTTNVPEFVECGTWASSDGDRSRYIERDDLRFVLDGQMNLFVESLGPSRTSVRVTTHYVLRDNARDVYEFTSNAAATISVNDPTPGMTPMRTCRSTHAAEKQILTAIGAISSR